MCMGFGCNAAGVVGCRIIDSPRERLIATLTNNFVPCNGRFAQPHKGQQKCCWDADKEETVELILPSSALNHYEYIKVYR